MGPMGGRQQGGVSGMLIAPASELPSLPPALAASGALARAELPNHPHDHDARKAPPGPGAAPVPIRSRI